MSCVLLTSCQKYIVLLYLGCSSANSTKTVLQSSHCITQERLDCSLSLARGLSSLTLSRITLTSQLELASEAAGLVVQQVEGNADQRKEGQQISNSTLCRKRREPSDSNRYRFCFSMT